MKITRIETLTCSSYRQATWVQIHTDEGLVGLGDTNFYEGRVATFIHETAAPYLLGQDPRLVERHHRALRTRMNFRRMNGEVNGLSAIDIALWDLYGQIVNLPIYQLLGGPARDQIRLYNTCHGSTHPFHWQPPDLNDPSTRWVRHIRYDEDEVMWKQQDRAAELAQRRAGHGRRSVGTWPRRSPPAGLPPPA